MTELGGFAAAILLVLVAVGMVGRAGARNSPTAGPVCGLMLTSVLVGVLLHAGLQVAYADHQQRVTLLHEEADALAEAWRHSILLPDEQRRWVRSHLLAYIDAKVRRPTERFVDPGQFRLHLEVWRHLAALPETSTVQVCRGAVNKMIKLHFRRVYADQERLPAMLWLSLGLGSLLLLFGLGRCCAPQAWLPCAIVMLSVATVLCSCLTLLADLNSPNWGQARVDSSNLVDLRNDMAQDPN